MSALRWLVWLSACAAAGLILGVASLPPVAADDAASPIGANLLRDREAMPALPPARRTAAGPAVQARFQRRAAPGRPPRIAIVIDDLGLDRRAFDRMNALPGPLTLSFLPYGNEAQAMVDDVRSVHETMLHLPTEPSVRRDDAGPDMLRVGDAAAIERALAVNLGKISGYSGVNNHTGSRFTGDAPSMGVLLAELDERGLYFLDSVTTPDRVAADLAASERWRVVERDVFLDADYAGGEAAVRAQLAELERIARIEGQAVAIGHPYAATAAALGPWLVTAQARGIELVTVGELVGEPRLTVAGLR